MKIAPFAIAATVALVSASGAVASHVEADAQNTLNKFGFSIDAGSLDRSQLVGIKAADSDSNRTRVEVQAAIQSVLNNG